MEHLQEHKNFNYPKFFAGRTYEESIPWLGSALYTLASSREASHKSLKNAYRHTNRQGESATVKCGSHLQCAQLSVSIF